MVENKIGLGSVKRFGVRYGTTPKFKLAKIEKLQKQPQKCLSCLKPKAWRIATGIYKCEKCGAKFTGGAYYVETKAPEAAEEEAVTEAPEEKED